jgi:hypothetical protein
VNNTSFEIGPIAISGGVLYLMYHFVLRPWISRQDWWNNFWTPVDDDEINEIRKRSDRE